MKEMAESTDPDWRESVVTTDESGMFWRILVPGVYEVQAVYTDQRRGRSGRRNKRSLVSEVRRVRVTEQKKQQFLRFTLTEGDADSDIVEDFGVRDGGGQEQEQEIQTASTSKLTSSDGQEAEAARKGFVFQ